MLQIGGVNIHLDEPEPGTNFPEEVSNLSTDNRYQATPSKRISKRVSNLNENKSIFNKLKKFHERKKVQINTTLTVFLFLFDIYKIFVGSFLTIFTTQTCDLLNERFNCFDYPFQWFALAFNIVTFVFSFVQLGYQVHRESYFIRELEIYPNTHHSIEEYFEKYPIVDKLDIYNLDIQEQVDYFNEKYSLTVKMSSIAFLLNVIFSSISLLTYSYIGSKTITSLLSNVLLLGLLIVRGLYVAIISENSEKTIACSAYKQDFVNYNGVNHIFRVLQKRKSSQNVTEIIDNIKQENIT
jgi:hypothetical protein